MGMSKRVKALIERTFNNAVWIGPATDPQHVMALIDRLRPWQNKRGLVRVGPSGDGGYLLPNDLLGMTACVSPGVSLESGFDYEIAERGIPVHMADASVDGPAIQHARFHFTKIFFGSVTANNTTTIEEFCLAIPGFSGGGDLLLQMDIEGAEWPVIQSMNSAFLRRFRIIVLEVHGLDNLFHAFTFDLIKASFDKLLEHHKVVHLHPNNCCGSVVSQGMEVPRVMEMTFYRTDRDTFERPASAEWPHPLDAENKPSNPALILPQIWR